MTRRIFRRRSSRIDSKTNKHTRTQLRSLRNKDHNRRRFVSALECLEDRVTPSAVVPTPQTLTVTTLKDVVDPNDGVLSLREAVTRANADNAGDTITFASGLSGTIAPASSLPEITADVTIQGPGAQTSLDISPTGGGTPFTIDSGAHVSVSGLKFSGGQGILFDSQGDLTLQDCWFDNNAANTGPGILIYSESNSSLTVEDSTFSDNSGLIYLSGTDNTLKVVNSTFTGNGGGSAGVITDGTSSGARVSIVGSTFVDTTVGSDLVVGHADVTVQDSIFTTASGNTSPIVSGELNPASSFNYFYGHFGTDQQIAWDGLATSANHNLLGPGPDPMLGPLQDNGGPVPTRAPLPGSPAIDAGPRSADVSTDQRGVSRPQGKALDIGAVELKPEPPSLVVTTLDDIAFSYDHKTSLREAIAYAETDPNPGAVETITFDPSLFAGKTPGTVTLSSALPALTGQITIDGPGSSLLTVSRSSAPGTPDFRIFTVSAGASVTLEGLTASGGHLSNTADVGAGIFNAGTLTMTNVNVTGNSTEGRSSDGGGIFNSGSLTMTGGKVSDNNVQGSESGGGGISSSGTVTMDNVTVSKNSTRGYSGDGGGLFNWGGGKITLTDVTIKGNSTSGDSAEGGGLASISSVYRDAVTLVRTTLSNNSTSGDSAKGGGLYLTNSSATLTNVTINGNKATGTGGQGGGISNHEKLSVRWSTITDNSAETAGGGIYNGADGTLNLTGTIVAGNTSGPASSSVADDINGGVDPTSAYNLVGVSTGLSGISNGSGGNLVGTSSAPIDPKLGPLQDNGGPTFTRELLAGSPALDAGPGTATDATDQRGVARITYRDLGAYQATASHFAVSGFPSPVTAGQSGTFSVTALDPFDKTDHGFQGQVHFSSSDPKAALPVDAALEDGVGTFSAALKTVGEQTISAVALGRPEVTGQQTGIKVAAAPVTALSRVVIGDGTAQRSNIGSITLYFNGSLTTADVPTSAFTLTRVGGGSPITVQVVVVSVVPTANGGAQVLLGFTGDNTEDDGASLLNGNYQLKIDGSQITDASGNAVDVDGDGAAGGTKTVDFFRFFGDSNGDGLVDATDYVAFRAAYLSGDAVMNAMFDANHDFQFTLADLQAFLVDFLKRTLSPTPPVSS